MHAALFVITIIMTLLGSRDLTGYMTVRLSLDDFLYLLNRNQTSNLD